MPGATDHKTIGTAYLILALAAGLTGGALSMVMRARLLHAGPHVGPAWDAIVVQHGLIMIVFGIMPALIAGYGNWFIPLMIAAPDMAFPRLNAASLCMAAAGFGLALTGLICGHGAGRKLDFTLLSLLLSAGSSLLVSSNFITTILNMRDPGMTLHRMPLFVWSQLVTAFLLLLAVPVLAGAVTVLVSRPHGDDAALFRQLFWFFGHPEICILILPGFGIASHVVSTFARRPIVFHLGAAYSMVAIGVIGFMVWAHHMFVGGLSVEPGGAFTTATLVIAAPTAIVFGCLVVTLRGGSIELRTPMLWVLGFIFLFALGGVAGVLARGPDAMVARFHYVLALSAVFAIFAGFYFWIGRMTGRIYPETLGRLHFWTAFLGVNLAFFPQLFPGAAGWSVVPAIGGFISGASMLLFLLTVAVTMARKPGLGWNRWNEGADTLGWSAPSPALPAPFIKTLRPG